MSSKPPLLFALPRSGSNLLYYTVLEYLRIHSNTKGLNEYFCNSSYYTRNKEGYIVQTATKEEGTILNVQNRLAQLKKCKDQTYFLKVFPGHLVRNSGLYLYLENSYDWFFLERKNVFENMLSFVISMITNKWYGFDNTGQLVNSLDFSERYFNVFENMHFCYLMVRARHKPKQIVYYEDLVADVDKLETLKKLNFNEEFCVKKLQLPIKQHTKNKLLYFKNPDLIIEKYSKSYLNKLSPIVFI